MKEKKSEVITIRVTPTTKKKIETEAEKREWSSSKLAEKILSTWVEKETIRGDDECNSGKT